MNPIITNRPPAPKPQCEGKIGKRSTVNTPSVPFQIISENELNVNN